MDHPSQQLDWLHDDLSDLRREMREGFASLHERLDDQDQRLRKLESWQSRVMGIAAAVAAIVSLGWSWLTGRRA